MATERTFRCDAPGCKTHMADCVTTVPPCPGWIVAYQTNGVGVDDCCMKYAAQFPAAGDHPVRSSGRR